MTAPACAARFLSLLTALAPLAAQVADPPAPPGGFPVLLAADQLVTFSDGYRTRADVRRPAAAPGSSGWPVLVLVHGFPGTKNGPVAAIAADYAARGYVAVTYDVRGQGAAIALNPGRGTTLMGLAEWLDLFEVMEWVERTLPAAVDFARLGVTGISQGGAHAWAAAAFSGRLPPPNPRRTAAFPLVRAVAPTVMVPSHTDAATLDGTAFVAAWANLAFAPPNAQVALDPAFQATMRSYVLADDPAGMRAWMRADPGRDFQGLLPTSATAALVTMAWLDEGMAANRSLQALAQLPPTTPRRAFLTTGLHGTPSNDYESARVDEVRRAWFDRFLKGAAEPVELGPAVVSACLPADRATYLAPGSLWRHRADPAFPPPAAAPQTFYLRQAGALAAAPPAAAEPPETVQHVVPAGYDLAAWRADGAGQNVPLALRRIPLSSFAYTTPPFAHGVDLAGIPELVLAIAPNQPRFQLAARLEVLVPGRVPQVLAEGGTGVRQAGGPAPATLRLELSATACVVPAGASLRLSVQNHYLVMAASTEQFRYLPVFVGSAVQIEHRPGALSWLELPVRAQPRPDAVTAAVAIPAALPQPVALAVQSSAQDAGLPYWLLASLAGQGPASALPGGDLLHLQPDCLSGALLAGAGAPWFQGFAGALDAQGRASARLDLSGLSPALLALRGLRLHCAPVVARGAGFAAGAPLELTIR